MKFVEKIEKIKVLIEAFTSESVNIINGHLEGEETFENTSNIVLNDGKLIAINVHAIDYKIVCSLVEYGLTEYLLSIPFEFNVDNCELLKYFSSLSSLSMYISRSFEAENIKHLNLSHLILHKESDIDTSDAFLESTQTLESLMLFTNKISDDDALLINASPRLNKLYTDAENLEIVTSDSVTCLDVDNQIDMLSIKNLSNLSSLSCSLNPNSGPLPDSSPLKKLTIRSHYDDGVDGVINLDLFCSASLETLKLNTTSKIASSQVNKHLKCLELNGREGFFSNEFDDLHFIKFNDKNDFKFKRILDNHPNLNQLYVSGYNVIDTENLSNNYKITNLTLNYCNLIKFDFIRGFKIVEEISLAGNFISHIPYIENIESIKMLNLYNNEMINIPKIYNRYFVLDEFCINRSDSRGILVVGLNPVINPSMDIIRRGRTALDSYFQSMQGDIEELNEAKIIFLGPGSVGKTSLMKCLSGKPFNPQENTTHGINIQKYPINLDNGSQINAKIWDFGGQQINHTTHQLFLSQRCVYVLVINDRINDEPQDQKIDYWLQQIKAFGGDSKVIIVRNKCDQFKHSTLAEGLLRSKFPNITSIQSVSCQENINISELRKILNEEVANLPMRQMQVPKNWLEVKNEVQCLAEKLDHFSLSKFRDICRKHGISDSVAQQTLQDLLNDLSLVIVFPELAAYDMGILNPHWITDGIYSIINCKEFEHQKGIITQQQVQDLLDIHPKSKYQHKAKFIIDSLLKFELCHTVGGDSSNTYLVPSLLPPLDHHIDFPDGENTIRLTFKYENLLPKSIFTKFLVRMNKDIAADCRWKSAAVLADASFNSKALVVEDDVNKTITIKTTGEQARDYFAVIRKTINDLNLPDKDKLGVQELVLLPGSGGATVPYAELLGYEAEGETTYLHGISRNRYDVSKLLSGIESRQYTTNRLSELNKKDINVHVTNHIENNSTTTNTNTVTQDQAQTQTTTQSVNITLDLQLFKGAAENIIDDLQDELEDEISDEKSLRRATRECDKVRAAIEDIQGVETEEQALVKAGSFDRLQRFFKGAIDGSSTIGESLTMLRETTGQVKELAKKYNSIASYFGLPTVPEILL